MARKNKFMEQETDFVGMLNEESSEDNLTKSIVRELNEHFESENEILTAPANMFIPYEDEKLRLDLHHGEDRERLKESIKLKLKSCNLVSKIVFLYAGFYLFWIPFLHRIHD